MTTEPEVPPLSPGEIALITPENAGRTDALRLLATIAALQANRRLCICTDTVLCAHHENLFVRPLELQIAKAERDYWELHAGLTAQISEQSDVLREIARTVKHIGGRATLAATVATMESKLREAEERIAAARKISATFPRWCEEKIAAALQDAKEHEEPK